MVLFNANLVHSMQGIAHIIQQLIMAQPSSISCYHDSYLLFHVAYYEDGPDFESEGRGFESLRARSGAGKLDKPKWKICYQSSPLKGLTKEQKMAKETRLETLSEFQVESGISGIGWRQDLGRSGAAI